MLPPGPPLPAAVQTMLWITRPIAFMNACRRRYGDVFSIRFNGLGVRQKLVFIADPAGVRTVFSGDPDVLRAGSGNRPLAPLLGRRSVLLLDGAEHLRQRKLLLPPLHGERMKSYEPVMRGITLDSAQRWPRQQAFALLPHMQSITLDVILRTVFGFDDDVRRDDMRARLQRMVRAGSGSARLVAMAIAQVELRGRSPWGRFMAAKRDVDEAILDQIRRRRERAGSDSGDDVLSLLLEARDEQGEPMSDDELRDELLTLLVAGHETTATSLAWAFDLLLHHPRVLERLVAELDAGETRYLDATIKETLRIRPVVPIVVRRLEQPFEVLGRTIPAGTAVAPCIYLTQRHPDVYEHPNRFVPDRFVDGAPDPYAWLPFGGGVRRCLGASFATFEMRVVLRTVLTAVTLRPASGTLEQVSRRAVTLVPRHGTKVVCVSRREAAIPPSSPRAPRSRRSAGPRERAASTRSPDRERAAPRSRSR